MSFEEFQDGCRGGHLGYRNGTILTILNLYVTSMPPIKFQLNLTYGLRDVVWGISRWISEQNNLAILNLYVASMPPIKFQLNLTYGLEELLLEEFQDGHCGGHLGYRNGMTLAIMNLCVSDASKFWLNPTYSLGGDVVWRISRWLLGWPSWVLEWNNFNNSESLCRFNASHKV